ncbi:MAG: hypothetical protein KAR54_00660 [Candidatus Pacebacteria bacterium]|nr:hypothetical protein [Candidatus Paceibacterota bacterium]
MDILDWLKTNWVLLSSLLLVLLLCGIAYIIYKKVSTSTNTEDMEDTDDIEDMEDTKGTSLLTDIWEVIPVSQIINSFASGLFGFVIFILLPNSITNIFSSNASVFLSWLFFALIWFFASSHTVPKEHVFVPELFRRRFSGNLLKIFLLREGFISTVIPRPIMGGSVENVREITVGAIEDKEGKTVYEAVATQSLDDVMMETKWSFQIKIVDPYRWFNIEDPVLSIKNNFLEQLRIIQGLFNSSDYNQMRGVISGLLIGRTYYVCRTEDGDLLKDKKGAIILTVLTGTDDEKAEVMRSFQEEHSSITTEYTAIDGKKSCVWEAIPPEIFDPSKVTDEVIRVGAEINSTSIIDVTPPEEIRKAGEEKRKEKLQKDARLEEVNTHTLYALTKMGKAFDDDREFWKKDDWERFKEFSGEPRILEGKAKEIVVRHIGSSSDENSNLGDSLIASQILQNKGEKD